MSELCFFSFSPVNIVMSHQEKFISDLMAEREKLTDVNIILKRNVEKLSRVVDNVNWTLGVILKFDNFPVNQYCPNKSKRYDDNTFSQTFNTFVSQQNEELHICNQKDTKCRQEKINMKCTEEAQHADKKPSPNRLGLHINVTCTNHHIIHVKVVSWFVS